MPENDAMLSFNRELFRSGIARHLITYVVLFSSFITVLTTALQLYRDYNNDIDLIEDQLRQAQDVHLKSLTAALWASGTRELKTHLEGIFRRRDMQFLEVRDREKVWVSVGTPQSENVMSRRYPMIYTHRGQDIEIGTLTVVASLSGVYQRLIDKVWVILLSNGIKTFLVAGFILIIFHALITRHLIRIAGFARVLDIHSPHKPLRLDRKGQRKQDALDQVVNAINQMQVNIKESFEALEHSEQALRESEQQQRDLLNNTSSVIYIKDREGRYLFINRMYESLFHCSDTRIKGKSDHDIFPKEMADAFRGNDLKIIKADTLLEFEEIVPQDDGEHIYISVKFPIKRASGEIYAVCGISTDISERKRVEETVRNIAAGVSAQTGEAFFKSLVMHLAKLFDADYALIGTLDKGDPLQVNTLAVCAHGQIVDNIKYSLAGTPCAEVMGQKTCTYSSGVQRLFPEDHMLVDMGVEGYIGAPLFDSRNEPLGILVVLDGKPLQHTEQVGELLEIFAARAAGEMERLWVEEELRKHRDHLEELVAERTIALETANQELEAFSYSVSHDLRAPLRSIDGFSQVLLEDYTDKLDEAGKDHLQRVRNASQRMGELIDDLLMLSRVTRREMHRNAIDLSKLAHKIAAQLREDQPDRSVEFMIQEGQTAHGDPHLLRIVLDNLFENAWKYSSKEAQAQIEFGAMEADGKPAYYVRDNGAGFDMKYAGKLFGAFQRLHKTEEFEGTGIGLATVARIIHRHGGRVWAEGEVGKGATFYFTLA